MSLQKVLEDSLSTINMSMNKQLTKMLSASNIFQPDADVFDKEGFHYIVIEIKQKLPFSHHHKVLHNHFESLID